MKKTKLISFIMVICMAFIPLMAMLSGCNSAGGLNMIQTRTPVWLVIYYEVEDSTTPEAVAAVQAAINNITIAKLTTQVTLVGLKPSEYEAAVDQRFADYDAAVQRQSEIDASNKQSEKESQDQHKKDLAAGIKDTPTKKPTETVTTVPTYMSNGRIDWKPYTPKQNQMDIFLITSAEMFEKLASTERLQQLDDELNTKAKVLNEYVHPSIMMAGQYDGKTIAIPTNKAIGTFTYIAVNKRLAEKYGLDLAKVKDYSDLTDYLVQVKENEPGVALMEGPFAPVGKFDSLFSDMPDFAVQSAAGKSLVYTPQQDPTEPPPTTTAAPETDADGNVITSEATTAADTAADSSQDTTIPATTSKPKPIPAKTNTTPDTISITNIYTNAAYDNVMKTNQDFRDKGLFETAPIPDDKERAAFVFTGTLEEQMAKQAADKYDYDYIVYSNPMATKSDLQNGMYAVSASSSNTVTRAMEIITLMNTNKQFKDIFEYGAEGTNFIYNQDTGLVQRLNQDYMVNMNYTGNNFIATLTADDNPNKWEIAKQQNLSVVNSVFLNFYLDRTKLTPASLASLDPINKLSQEVKQALLTGNIPTDYADIASYISDYVTPAFKDAGTDDLITDIKNYTNPAA